MVYTNYVPRIVEPTFIAGPFTTPACPTTRVGSLNRFGSASRRPWRFGVLTSRRTTARPFEFPPDLFGHRQPAVHARIRASPGATTRRRSRLRTRRVYHSGQYRVRWAGDRECPYYEVADNTTTAAYPAGGHDHHEPRLPAARWHHGQAGWHLRPDQPPAACRSKASTAAGATGASLTLNGSANAADAHAEYDVGLPVSLQRRHLARSVAHRVRGPGDR